MRRILKRELDSPAIFKEGLWEYIQELSSIIQKDYGIELNNEEIGGLLLSACRSSDFDIIDHQRNRMFLNEDRVLEWIEKKLLPNIVIIRLDDEDVIRLLIFCIEITYQMFGGGTKATVTQKGFRQRRRTFESVLVDQFVGKLGEIFVKKYLENNYPPVNIGLDWEISTQIEKHRSDITNTNKSVSIKSSPTLAGVWAEAGIGYDYGITAKCSVPQQPILQFFIEVCGFSRLLNFAEEIIPPNDGLFKDYLGELRERIKGYKCGEIQTALKGFICGYFKTSEYAPINEGVSLPYLGIVREERYLIPIDKLRWTKDEWKEFLCEIGLL